MKIIVREAGLDDAQLIADLTRAAWDGKVPAASSGHRETAVRVLQDLQMGGGFILLMEEKPVGSVRCGKSCVWVCCLHIAASICRSICWKR